MRNHTNLSLPQQINHFEQRVNRHFPPRNLCINAGTLKIIACITMFIDHVATGILKTAGPNGIAPIDMSDGIFWFYYVLALIGRQAFPIYAFMIAEGYIHTRSKIKYMLRLLLFAIFAQYPYYLLNKDHLTSIYSGNTIFTLLIGLLAIWVVDTIFLQHLDQKKGQVILRGISSLLAVVFFCWLTTMVAPDDYVWGGVLSVLAFYLFRRVRIVSVIISWLTLAKLDALEVFSFPAMILIRHYNGQRGLHLKWFFYLFYPCHFLVILGLRWFILGY